MLIAILVLLAVQFVFVLSIVGNCGLIRKDIEELEGHIIDIRKEMYRR